MHKTSGVIGQVLAVVGSGLILDLCTPEMAPSAPTESFNVKPGAWEMTVTTVASGMKLSQEMAAKMTPMQRAQMEQMMKAREGKPHTLAAPSCLTKEDVAHDRIIKEMEEEDEEAVACKVKLLSKSSSKLVLDQICPGPPASTTHLTIEAKTTDRIVAIGDRDQQGSGKAHMEITGKWLGASCEGIEE